MLPRWHIILGFIFCIIFKIISPDTEYLSLFLIWFASVFIDFDHYLSAGFKHKKWNPIEAINHNIDYREQMIELKKEKDSCEKGDFHIFHTLESHIIIGIIGIFFTPFFFIFIGMTLHSILDLIWMVRHDVLNSREFFLINKLRTFIL